MDACALQEALVERQGEQIAQCMATSFAIQVRENHLEVAAELPQNLTTGATRRRRRVSVGDDDDASKLAMAFRKRLEHRHALGTNRQPVGGVLDVAPGDDGTFARFERRTHFEM